MNTISIICPTYNSAKTLIQLIESVLTQTCDNYELIIVDALSTDGTADILKRYEGRLRYVSEKDNGIYDAMNKGAGMAQGEWLYFIGADDTLFSPQVVAQLQPLLDTEADIVMCDIMSPRLGRCKSRYSWQTFLRNTIHHQGVIYRRKILMSHPYDTRFAIMSDYEMALHVWESQCRIHTADIIMANHSPEGVSGKPNIINYKEEIAIRNRYLRNPLAKVATSMFSYAKWGWKNFLFYWS